MVFSNAPPQRGVCILYTFVLLKIMNRFLFNIALLLIVLVFAFSCKKVSNNKLDGKWELSSAIINSSNTGPGDSFAENFTLNNSLAKTTLNTNGNTIFSEFPYSQFLTFDRKSGKYFKEINFTFTDTIYTTAYNTENEPQELKIMQVIVSKNLIVENGTFSVTGNSGDIKRNSQLVMIINEEKNVLNISQIIYPEIAENVFATEAMDATGWVDVNGKSFSSEKFESLTRGTSSEGIIFFVEGLKGGIMELKSNTNFQTTSFSGEVTTAVKEQKLIYAKHRNFQ
jgi:hypothetical protein